MNILFITQYYPPEIGAASNRIGYFAKFLAKAGHEISVLTGAPNYPEGKLYEGYQNRFTAKNEDGLMVYRAKIFLSTKKKTLSRLAHYLSFIISSLIAKSKIQKPDLIIATSPPLFVGILGVLFKKLWKVPLITDIRDIWPESVESVGAVKNKRLLKQGEKLARWIYKNSNHITVTSPGIQKLLAHAGGKKLPPTTILPNGAELDLFRVQGEGHRDRGLGIRDQIEKTRSGYGINKSAFVALYTGNLGLAQAPEIFIKTAEFLKGEPDIALLIVGSGVALEGLKKQAQEKNLTNIIFTGAQPRSTMPHFVAASDVCIIPYKAADTFRNTFPSKMFDYMAGEKPIIINLKGEASELIEKAQCGLTAQEEDPKNLAEKILEFKENPEQAKQLGKNGRMFVEANFSRDTIARDLDRLIKTF